MSEIMLATSYDPDKITYPVEVSIKLDGIAADLYKTPTGWVAQSRQGKPIISVGHIVKYLNHYFKDVPVNTHLIGELTVVDTPDFKAAGGIIRRQVTDTRIIFNMYDMYTVGFENKPYAIRIGDMTEILKCMYNSSNKQSKGSVVWPMIRRVPVCDLAHTPDDLEEHLANVHNVMGASSTFEGFVLRCTQGKDSHYKIGKRSKGMMKYKPKPTVDLEILGFEEATANKDISFLGEDFAKGDGLRAVGRIIAKYKGKPIGVGPGCLKHAERRSIWEGYLKSEHYPDLTGRGLIAEVEHMLDDTYEALRQPVFKCWRIDKTEPSEVV